MSHRLSQMSFPIPRMIFILKVLPVLETIGNVVMAPFKPKGLHSYREQHGES